MNAKYRTYLLSDEWKSKREAKLKQAGFACAICGRNTQLEVHHLHYQNIFRETLRDLVVLCSYHHAEIESLFRSGQLHRSEVDDSYSTFILLTEGIEEAILASESLELHAMDILADYDNLGLNYDI
jgi:hypothetical protein